MIDFETYISQLTDLLKAKLGCRLLYIGLQGSYLRGEATPDSDLDIMVIIDQMSIQDLDIYRSAIASLEHFDKSCGFICSKEDLANWNPLEIFHVLRSTKDYFGSLSDFVPVYTETDVRNFVKMSLNNLYHEICHRYIHAGMDKNIAYLPGTYKGVFFILQNLHYLQTGNYIATKAALLSALDGKNKAVLHRSLDLTKAESYDFAESFALLFTWCQETLASIDRI